MTTTTKVNVFVLCSFYLFIVSTSMRAFGEEDVMKRLRQQANVRDKMKTFPQIFADESGSFSEEKMVAYLRRPMGMIEEARYKDWFNRGMAAREMLQSHARERVYKAQTSMVAVWLAAKRFNDYQTMQMIERYYMGSGASEEYSYYDDYDENGNYVRRRVTVRR